MRGATGRHLGERAAALVDGELGVDARDRALAHLATCDDCRAEVAAQRRLKARLGGLGEPAPPTWLTDRLAGLGPTAPAVPTAPIDRSGGDDPAGRSSRPADRPPPARPPGRSDSRRFDGRRPGGAGPGARRAVRRRAVHVVAAGGASLVALGLTAFLAGGSGAGPTVVPDVQQLSVEHASTTGEVPFEVPIPAPPKVFFRQVSAP